MKKIILLAILILAISLSCSKEKDETFENGLILDFGDPAVDGCGWVIEINTTTYKPLDLGSEFQKDSLRVEINYNIQNTMADCGLAQNVYPYIHIIDIKEK